MKARGVPALRRRDILKAAGVVVALSPLLMTEGAAAAGEKVRIAIVGSGNVGSALGRVWANAGHPVMFSSRTLDHDKQ